MTTEALDTPAQFQTKLIVGWTGTLTCFYFIVFILKRIELNKNLIIDKRKEHRFATDEIGKDTKLTVTTSDDETISTTLDSPEGSTVFESRIHDIASVGGGSSDEHDFELPDDPTPIRRRKLRLEEKLALYGMVSLILFLTYLLLVYLPSGAVASLIGILAVTIVILKTQIASELRRKRFDRLAAMITLMIFAASFLSLMTYATIGMKEGTIYEGPARIIGYDTSSYQSSNTGAGDAERMDLEVAWGGDWACPDVGGVQCQAFVSGALCEADEAKRLLDEYEPHEVQPQPFQRGENDDEEEEDAEEEELIVEEEEVEELSEEVEILEEENYELGVDNEILGEEVEEADETAEDVLAVAETYYEKSEEATEDAKYYKELANEYAEGEVDEMGELMEEEVVAEYESAVAEDEAALIEQVTDNDEVVEQIVEQEQEYYQGLEDEVEEFVEELEYDYSIDEVDVDVDVESDDTNMLDEVTEEIIQEEEDQEFEQEIEQEIEEYYGVEPIMSTYNDDAEDDGAFENNAYTGTGGYYSYYNSYSWADDAFEDDWWTSSWTDVWGEYACNDLFDSDMEGMTYDADEAPGVDGWPFVNIYGSCNRCEAYLVDYYSTEHFNNIKKYQAHAVKYAVVGSISFVVTSFLVMRQWITPAEENRVDLLMYDGGREFV